MSNTESSNTMNLVTTLEQTSSLIEELAKTYAQIEAQDDASRGNVEWKHIEGHFRHLQSAMKKKLEDLDAKEKDVIEKEKLLTEKEATVTTKEQDVLDRVQELKDAAVDAIIEVKANCSVSDEDPDAGPTQAMSEELTHVCERMDSEGLLDCINNNLSEYSHICRGQLPLVLTKASEPTRLVLDAVERFFTTTQDINDTCESCLLLLEGLSEFMGEGNLDEEGYLTHETKQRAKAIADEWKSKLVLESDDAVNGESLEARAFLRLLVSFKIGSEFDEEELCKCVLAISNHMHATELCRSLELGEKVPGIIEKLLKNEKNMDAVNFILFFNLSESYPPVPLLKTYLREVRRKVQGDGLPETQNARELIAVEAVLRCVNDYKLEDEFPLDTLKKRFIQLQRSVRDKKKNKDKYQVRKTYSNTNTGSLEPEPLVFENGAQDFQLLAGPIECPSDSPNVPNSYQTQIS